jgi:hypothetical protein
LGSNKLLVLGVVEKTVGDAVGADTIDAATFTVLVAGVAVKVTTAGTAGVPLGNVEAWRLLVASVSSTLMPPLPFTSAKIE